MSHTQFKTKTRNQMASEYGIDYKTFMRRLKRNEIDLPNGLIYPKFQKEIYEELGYPYVELKIDFAEM